MEAQSPRGADATTLHSSPAGPTATAPSHEQVDRGAEPDHADDPEPSTGAAPGTDTGPIEQARARTGSGQGRVDLRFALTIALGLAGGVLLAGLVTGMLSRLQGLLVTLIVSLFLSFAMEPGVQWLARRGVRRGLGTFVVFLAALLLLVGFLAAMAPLVVDQVDNLVKTAPELLRDLSAQAGRLPGELGDSVSQWLDSQRTELPSRLSGLAADLGRGVLGVSSLLLGGVLQFFTTLLVTFYLVADGPRLRRALSSRLAPQRQRELMEIWELAITKTGGYVYSRALTAVASAAVHVVAFTLLGLPFAAALGVWVGIVSSLIPVIGTYLAGALPLLIALTQGPATALAVLATVVVYQQLENYLVAPRITATTMELHPALAFLSVLVGGALLGAAGALLALPAAAIVAALASAYGERHEVVEHGLVEQSNPGA